MLKYPGVGLVLGLALAAMGLLAPLPQNHSRAFLVLENATHAPLFAGLTWLALRALRLRFRSASLAIYLSAWLLITAFGALSELAQHYTGRDASWEDLANDALGAGLSLLCMARREARIAAYRVRLLMTLALLVGLIVYALPLLAGAAAYGQRWAQWPVLWRQSSPLRDYFMVPLRGPQYSGVTLEEPRPDWRGYRTLEIDVHNAGTTPIVLTVRVHDAHHDWQFNDRYNRAFALSVGGATHIEIPLTDIGQAPRDRRMDLAQIAGLALFRADGAQQPGFGVESIRLVR